MSLSRISCVCCFTLSCLAGIGTADTITLESKTYTDIKIHESESRYYFRLPDSSEAVSVSKQDIDPADVQIERWQDAEEADASQPAQSNAQLDSKQVLKALEELEAIPKAPAVSSAAPAQPEPANPAFMTFADDKVGISCEYPEHWGVLNLLEITGMVPMVAFTSNAAALEKLQNLDISALSNPAALADMQDTSGAGFTVINMPPLGMQPIDFFNMPGVIEGQKNALVGGAVVQMPAPVTIKGNPGATMIVRGNAPDGVSITVGTTALSSGENMALLITSYPSDREAEFAATFKKMMDSVIITKFEFQLPDNIGELMNQVGGTQGM